MHQDATTNAAGVRRAFLWAGLIIGQAILLRGITDVTTWLYVFLLTLIAFMVDQPFTRTPRLQPWGGLIQAGLIVAMAVMLRIFITL
jgi:hypothetical protein